MPGNGLGIRRASGVLFTVCPTLSALATPFGSMNPMLVIDPFAPAPPPPGNLALLRVSRRAMATTFEIAIPYGTPHALPAAEAALDLIDANSKSR